MFFCKGFSFTSVFDSSLTVSIRSPSLTLSPILILIFSIIPSDVEGTSTLDLSLSIVIKESFFLIFCPALTRTSMTSTSLKSPMFGTKISLGHFIISLETLFLYLFCIFLIAFSACLDAINCSFANALRV